MSKRARLAVAAAVAVASLAGIVALAVHLSRSHDTTGRLRFATTTRAVAPFGAFSEAHVAVGDRCLRLLVATTEAQRVQGLRQVRDLGPYEGMLFVFPSATDARFTMAQTPLPLDIGWFSAAGDRVDRTTMTPCPKGTDATCPTYASEHDYRYALETRAGALPTGSLGSCSS